jgi:predicted nucleic acid-binding protein
LPRAAFGPEEGGVPEETMSEVTRSILVQRPTADDPGGLPEARAQAGRNAERLAAIHEMHGRGELRVDVDEGELATFGRLTSKDGVRELGLRFPLGAGEAACVALAVSRSWVLATDDQDALTALEALSPGHGYERIRRLLQRAASRGLISEAEANALHAEMRRPGFRDHTAPFPQR